MLRRTTLVQVAALVLLIVFGSAAVSQVDRSAYRYSTIEEIIATHRLKVGPSSEPAERDTVLIAPEYKYRLQLKATGRIRELTPEVAEAMSAWSRAYPDLAAPLKEYTHEVEVSIGDQSLWLAWQRSLVAPFRTERSSGGNVEIYAVLGGAFHGKVLLFVTAFESLA
jgi:hypothetical protein